MSNVDLLNEIRSARAEMASWSEEKKAATQLEGTDMYFEKEQKQFSANAVRDEE